ncbi:ComF family protein [Paraglaciecola psychrophila]|jgi:ComF family protein|uniref:Amidophosphoribosyltransferases-like protein n=1 Tax=Paraglaciecola psychrophila 170 TaxID=1129794 RepID=K6YWJ4_9ALTE|nr:ComF family protein [Paraglaciecola psychrophila]AGH47519.1 amidophosphoribosyltransferases-like protein [Paraglaciecola psychrophila 170]GAC37089.1 amidophosphoribosyltransferase-like protein [Paraglaciecola psychrophila 170]
MQIALSQSCLVCKQTSNSAICQYCTDDLTLFDIDRYHHNLMLSPKINKGLVNVDFPQVLALADYQWPLSKLLTGLKFSKQVPNAHALATLFVKHCLRSNAMLPQLIIPMPLHKNRYLFRKFNQSIELTKQICSLSQLDMDTSIISRCKSTPAQTDLSAAQRRKNLQNAFAIDATAAQRLKNYKHIALFDDVITTGSTMNAAYRSIRKHHPSLKIDVWSICLTLTH